MTDSTKTYAFTIIEGQIRFSQRRGNILNLLAAQQGTANLAAGVAGAATGQFGTAANAALVANYEGEEVELFACYIGDQLVEGVFSRVMFEDGDYVKAVVQQQKGGPTGLYAHAVLRPKDGLLSMPYNTGRGTWAELRKNFRWGAWLALGTVLCNEHFQFAGRLGLGCFPSLGSGSIASNGSDGPLGVAGRIRRGYFDGDL